MEHKQVMEWLKGHSMLQAIPEHELDTIASEVEVFQFEPHQNIIVEDELDYDCYFIVQGKVRVTSLNLIGQLVIMAELSAGDIVGEMGMLRRQPRSATVTAVEAVIALRVNPACFDRLSEWSPLFHESMLVHVNIRYLHSLLRKASVFSAIPDSELRGIAEIAQLSQYQKGDTIIRKGDPIHSLYMVSSGAVEIRSSRRKTILRAGDFFGEAELLTDRPSAAYGVKALEDGELILLDQAFFKAILDYYLPVKQQMLAMLDIRNPEAGKLIALSSEARPATQSEERKAAFVKKDNWFIYLLSLGGSFVLLSVLVLMVPNIWVKLAALLLGGLFVPITFVAYVRNQQLLAMRRYSLVLVFLLTPLIAIPISIYLGQLWYRETLTDAGLLQRLYNPFVVAVVEELSKLMIVAIVLRARQIRFLMDAVVFGAAAGMGFAAIESMIYGWNNLQGDSSITMLVVLWIRSLLAPFGHGTWTAITAAGLWLGWMKRSSMDSHKESKLNNRGLWLLLWASAIGLHTCWNYSYSSSVLKMIAMTAVGALGIGLLLLLIKRGRSSEATAILILNPEDVRAEAGQSNIMLYCTACGTTSPPLYRYCARCGQALHLKANS